MTGSSIQEARGANGARRGEQVLQRLRERPPALWYRGEPVADATVHAVFRGGVATLTELDDVEVPWERVFLLQSGWRERS